MTPTVQFLEGDCRETLKTLPDESVHCVVTSPPYWGLRDYGVDGQLGWEKTPEAYLAKMVAVFREVKRVLRKDGTTWVNMGDAYWSSSNRGSGGVNEWSVAKRSQGQWLEQSVSTSLGLKPKDLCGIPWRLAFALQADGWWLRQWMPWVKRNSMPESAQDRPVVSCETIFLLSKSERYYYDAEAVKLPGSMALLEQISQGYNGKATKDFAAANAQNASDVKARIIAGHRDKQRGHSRRHDGFNDRWDQMEKEEQCNGWRSCRNSDWFFESIGGMLLNHDLDPLAFAVNPQPYPGSHFATFPPALVKPCILSGTSARGCCPKCKAPYERMVEKSGGTTGKSWHDHSNDMGAGQGGQISYRLKTAGDGDYKVETLGWRPGCECGEETTVAATILDPFGGSGTTGMVALELGRNAILCELNPAYLQLARQRCCVTPGLAL